MIRIVRTARALALVSLAALLATAVAQGMPHAPGSARGGIVTPPGTFSSPMGMGLPMVAQTVAEQGLRVDARTGQVPLVSER